MQPTNQQSINDDQELAKVLAGITQQAGEQVPVEPTDDLPEEDLTEPTIEPTPEPVVSEPVETTPTPVQPPVAGAPAGDNLESIKQDALMELRPLVDKLEVSPDEKFDTYLLLLRSTDDTTLIAPAFAAARAITDETRRAQALLDTIKEIDYLSAHK